jgi:hypothetical protein
MQRLTIFLVLIFCTSLGLIAKPTTYVNSGLDRETVISLEINDGKVTGGYRQHPLEGEGPIDTGDFSGKIIESPAGKEGTYMEIQFKGSVPYDTKEGKIIWCLRAKNGDKKLYVPILGRDFTTQPPKIKSYKIQLEALPENFEGD